MLLKNLQERYEISSRKQQMYIHTSGSKIFARIANEKYSFSL